MRGYTGCWDDLCWGPVDFCDSDFVSESRQVARERELIPGLSPLPGFLEDSTGMSGHRWMLKRVCSLLGACNSVER
jgi:hypothetical protein